MTRLAVLALVLTACSGATAPAAPPVAQPETKPAPDAASEATAEMTAESPPHVEAPSLPEVELVQTEHASGPASMPALSIVAPAKGQLVSRAKAPAVAVKIRAAGWALARDGNDVCVVLDKKPCRRVTDLGARLTLADLDPALEEGQHVLTVYARRASTESVKPAGKRAAFASTSFFVGKRTRVWSDGGPMLFFSPPDDAPAPPEGVLLDPYVANADFGPGRYRLHVSVSGPGLGGGKAVSVATNKPWRLKNARPGNYIVDVSLFRYEAAELKSSSAVEVSFESKLVPGPFAEVSRTFRVTAK